MTPKEIRREEDLEVSADKNGSTAAILAAAAAKEFDKQYRNKQKQGILESIDEAQRVRVEDVRRRQLEVLFGEAPDFERFLPGGVSPRDLLPEDPGQEVEALNRRLAERENEKFLSRGWLAAEEMGWMFNKDEVVLLAQVAGLWTRATRGEDCPMGMDRSTLLPLHL